MKIHKLLFGFVAMMFSLVPTASASEIRGTVFAFSRPAQSFLPLEAAGSTIDSETMVLRKQSPRTGKYEVVAHTNCDLGEGCPSWNGGGYYLISMTSGFSALDTGKYRLTVSAPGFFPEIRDFAISDWNEVRYFSFNLWPLEVKIEKAGDRFTKVPDGWFYAVSYRLVNETRTNLPLLTTSSVLESPRFDTIQYTNSGLPIKSFTLNGTGPRMRTEYYHLPGDMPPGQDMCLTVSVTAFNENWVMGQSKFCVSTPSFASPPIQPSVAMFPGFLSPVTPTPASRPRQ